MCGMPRRARPPDRGDVRIAVLNWSRRRAGGIETYLSALIPELARVGHDVGFLYEVDAPRQSEPIPLEATSGTWAVEELGCEQAIDRLRDWQPQILYSHGLLSPDLESKLLNVAPAMFFAHSYYGTCISGAK